MDKKPIRCPHMDNIRGALLTVSAMMASSWEDSPSRRVGLVIHDLEAARAQSTARPRDFRRRGHGRHHRQSSDKAETSSHRYIASGGRSEHTITDNEVPEPDP